MAKKNFKGGLQELLGNNSGAIELTILPELQSYIPPLNNEEIKLLRESIKNEGIKDPIDIWVDNEYKSNIIIDGHNRYNIAKNLEKTFPTKEHHFDNIDEVKEWMLRKQLGRRNLTDANRSYLIGLLYNKQKEDKGGNDKVLKGTKRQILPFGETPMNKGEYSKNTDDKIAKETGTSPRSVRNAGDYAEGLDKLDSNLKKDILSGKEKVPKGKIQKLAKVKGKQEPIKSKDDIDKALQKDEKVKVKHANIKPVDEHISAIENKQSKSEENSKIAKGEKYTLAQVSELSNDIINVIKQKKAGEELTLKAVDLALKDILDVKSLQCGNADFQKLIDKGFTILRCDDNPTPRIKKIDSDNTNWHTFHSDFKSKAARDRKFKELLKDQLTIQG